MPKQPKIKLLKSPAQYLEEEKWEYNRNKKFEVACEGHRALVTKQKPKSDLLRWCMLQPEQPSLSSYLVKALIPTAASSPIAESTVI